MPKELTHWILAEKTFEKMDASVFKNFIQKYKQLYYIGAVILDSPFYNLFSKQDDPTTRLGKQFHDQSEFNLYRRFINILRRFNHNPPDSFWAFIAGVITHIHADQTFHPFIFYFCGKGPVPNAETRETDQARHRKLEAFLDLHYMDDIHLINDGRLWTSIKQMNISQQKLCEYASLLYFQEDFYFKKIEKILKKHATIQDLFRKSMLRDLLTLINRMPGTNLSTTLSLFYPTYKKITLPFFNNPIVYKHPVTGETHRDSIGGLEKKVITENLTIFTELDHNLNTPDLEDALSSIKSASLETGLPPDEHNVMKYFDRSETIERLVGHSIEK